MKASHSLPVIMPNIAQQRWSCHSCGDCCRTLVIHLSDEERERIDWQGWAGKLSGAAYVRIGPGWTLNKQDNGACVFLDENNRCRIHSEFGERAKPLACQVFPFSVRPVGHGWQASLRFDCPSVSSSVGKPLSQHRARLTELVKAVPRDWAHGDDVADLRRGVRATSEEIDAVIQRFSRWVKSDTLPIADRLIGAARITTTVAEATLAKVRDRRFAQLLDLLFDALRGESAAPPGSPTVRQRGMLLQLAFAHTEHATLAQMRSGFGGRLRKRWQQLGSARKFLKGTGVVPGLPGLAGHVTFEAVESIEPPAGSTQDTRDVESLVVRYLTARLEGRSVFGDGYYGWPVVSGVAALWLSVAAAGWLARYAAAVEGRSSICITDAARALGMVDRAATRLPVLGAVSERARVAYLLKDDGLARLIHEYSLFGGAS